MPALQVAASPAVPIPPLSQFGKQLQRVTGSTLLSHFSKNFGVKKQILSQMTNSEVVLILYGKRENSHRVYNQSLEIVTIKKKSFLDILKWFPSVF